jgi:putative endonuclease
MESAASAPSARRPQVSGSIETSLYLRANVGIFSRLPWFASPPAPLGVQGERYAARWLHRRGYKIVAGGKRSRFGEIDLVAIKGRLLVFIEVKTRRSGELGHPAEAVGPDKQRRIVRAALAFMKENGLSENPCRFDVMALIWPASARHPAVQHFESAFDASGHSSMFS